MISIIFVILFMAYLIFFHEKQMNKLGLTPRDQSLTIIGFFAGAIISTVGQILTRLDHGRLDYSQLLLNVVFIAFFAYCIRARYKGL